MPLLNRPLRTSAVLMLLAVEVLWASTVVMAQNPPASPSPLLPENAVTRVSEHVYVILGFPNIGFVRKDKEGRGNWLLRGALIGIVVAPISIWVLTKVFALAAYVLNTYIVK